jgi:hypothetical protein
MKKIALIIAALFTIGTASSQVVLKNKLYKNKNKDRFSVKENVVYYDGKALAKYQAKTCKSSTFFDNVHASEEDIYIPIRKL